MAKLVESIPNISEGRRTEVIEACVEQIRSTPGCTLLDYSSDKSHNRSVITYIGSPEAVETASVKLIKEAAVRIDLKQHEGVHPRMGAVDVMPFVPLRGCTMEECTALAKRVGKRSADEAGVPVFLYENSAQRPERKDLAAIRKGQFEGMAEKVCREEWEPDFGGRRIHPTAGVTAIGARPPLIAYNLNLNTEDAEIAKKIAEKIRERNGGFKCVKALGFLIEDSNSGEKYAQVSMNLTDYRVTSMAQVTEAVKREAEKFGTEVTESELIGLCPMEALADTAEKYLQLKNFDFQTQVLENHIL